MRLFNIRFLLLAWFDASARVLPWRDASAGSRDAYKTWLSEVLLQQMQVSRAVLYFERFLEVFPSVQVLAAAPLDAVLKLWEGAGYYARARNLHRAAQILAVQGFPVSGAAWQELPGVGRYSAAAIASLSANEAVAAVDGNVRRVLARLENMSEPTSDWLWGTAGQFLEVARAGAWNEALIELGATVCTPKKPACLECPVAVHCKALAAGTVLSVPAPKARAKVKLVLAVALVVHWQGRVLLELRPKKGLLGGLYGVPLEPIISSVEAALEVLVASYLINKLPVFLGLVSHTMTHRQFEIQVFGLEFIHPDLVLAATRAVSRLDRKVLVLLESDLQVARS